MKQELFPPTDMGKEVFTPVVQYLQGHLGKDGLYRGTAVYRHHSGMYPDERMAWIGGMWNGWPTRLVGNRKELDTLAKFLKPVEEDQNATI